MKGSPDTLARLLCAAFFVLLFFVWGTAGRFWTPFAVYAPSFHILFAALCVILFLAPVRRPVPAIGAAFTTHRYLLFPLAAFIATLLITILVFQGIPHIQDGIHYRMMADQLAHGRMDHPMHPHYEFFRFLYLIPDGERIASLFLPGYPLFLAPFALFGIAFLANPLLTAANVAIVGRIADDLYGPRVSAAAMALAILSPFLMIMGGTGMAHPFCAFLTLTAVLFFLRSRREEHGRRALIFAAIAGFSLGWLAFCRPQNAFLLALPLALAALFELRRRGTVPRGLALSAAFLPWLVVLLLHNAHYTGDLFTLRQDIYFNYSEPNDGCFGLGLGRACPNATWRPLPDDGFTLTAAVIVTYHRLAPLIANTLGHPLLFLLVPCAFLFARGRRLRRELFLASIFLMTVGGHFLYYFDGNVFGPRYYYETSFFLMILAASGLVALADRIAAARRPHLFAAPVGGFVAAAYLFTAAVILPPLFDSYAFGFWGVGRALADEVARQGIHNAVVFIQPEQYIGSGLAVMRHDEWDANDVVYVRDLGDRPNSALMHHYAPQGRRFYRALFTDIRTATVPPLITPIAGPDLPPNYLVAEMEDKHYPLRGVPDYCNEYPNRSDLSKYVSFPPPESIGVGFSKRAFFCRFTAPGQFYEFGQQFFLAGRYTIDVVGVTGPEMGRFRVLIDGRATGIVDFTGERYEKVIRQVEATVPSGFRRIRLDPEDAARETYFLLDLMEFFRRPEE